MTTENEDKTTTEDNAVSEEKVTSEKIVNNEAEKKSGRLSRLLMAMVVAIPAGLIFAYIVFPNQLNQMFSFVGVETNTEVATVERAQAPLYPVNTFGAEPQEPEWVTKLQAEMEKRRAEYREQAEQNRPKDADREMPQWMQDRQAEMKQRRAEFEQQVAANNQAAAEQMPAWVKEQQKQHQDWAKRAANPPWVTNSQNMNGSQTAPAYSGQVPAFGYNPYPYPYYNGYAPVSPYHYPAPYYGPRYYPFW